MLETIRNIAVIVGSGVALATLVRTLREYVLQGTQKRAEAFFSLRERLEGDDVMRTLLRLAQSDDPSLSDIDAAPYQTKYNLLGYFEEVALMMNSGLIRPEVAWYMFGYYALRVHDSEHFWSDPHLVKTDLYWATFMRFAQTMAKIEAREAGKFYSRHSRTIAATRKIRF